MSFCSSKLSSGFRRAESPTSLSTTPTPDGGAKTDADDYTLRHTFAALGTVSPLPTGSLSRSRPPVPTSPSPPPRSASSTFTPSTPIPASPHLPFPSHTQSPFLSCPTMALSSSQVIPTSPP
ncbi:hypothetical protein J3R82DRAFT_11788 [Butyriboletus roseoflavus]|nr:hypothetical protein J3R82DRAFT_11788 [Butyriboletus roseoflavus]